MKTKLQIFERLNYGTPNIYPAGPLAEAVSGLTGRKTLQKGDILNLKMLGIEIEIIADPRSKLAMKEAA
jgi:hypothetical protein